MTEPQEAVTPLITARGVTKCFSQASGGLFGRGAPAVNAVDGVSLDIMRGETLALVGESGCGKSTTGRLLMRLIEPSSGSIRFDGMDLMALDRAELRTTRRRLQLIFQDPSSAFNPRMTAEAIIAEPMLLAGITPTMRHARVRELLPLVGLAEYQASLFPHEFSGGQRQRIGIARALALRPDFIVCDEPVSALDVSIQAQIVNLMTDLRTQFSLTYLFISHDLRVVRHIATRVAVMFLGRIVELADKQALYRHPQHPYTQALLSAVPQTRPGARKSAPPLPGEVDLSARAEGGCLFAPRCAHVMPVCRRINPAIQSIAPGHAIACHLINGH